MVAAITVDFRPYPQICSDLGMYQRRHVGEEYVLNCSAMIEVLIATIIYSSSVVTEAAADT
jgi:hypothetical protein